ncbi:hypothetical protein DFH08DRAFT_803329 [Mycena albidolilacea]|uniref:Uncharacterized protein n=1 Tax=Mycena albidolilacea TaxID=1033008 RepID=A0AAD7ACF2_9AGAR|nr:hypothetical protein DFH08DRAFT_803329 [Mycena albidolilacea]
MNIFPPYMDKKDTPADVLAKCLFYFDTIEACGTAVETLRKCLLAHLRLLVQTFKSTLSEAAKVQLWDRLTREKSASSVQLMPQGWDRWERTACDRSIFGTCILLISHWAFRPEPVDAAVVSGPQKKAESKADTDRRKKLDSAMEALMNAG